MENEAVATVGSGENVFGACKYSLSCKVWIGVNQAAIYRTAGEVNSYEAAVAVCETFSKRLYALATAGENHAER
jgi:hypothetical protein